jgi:DNA-binding transcriptional ArsR family regulator
MNLSNITFTAAALSDPTRLRMLLTLDRKVVPVGELAAAVGVVPSVGTHHLKRLVEAGLVTARRSGRSTLVRRREDRWRQVCDAFGG